MAAGVARTCVADWGLATTGVAGPEPQDGHAVGEVHLAVAHPATGDVVTERLDLTGDRASIRQQSAERALWLLLDALAG
jgi:nicotinamide-nucleotide amidase